MRRTLPKNKSNKQKLIIAAVYDYFGVGSKVRANQIAIYIMGKRRGVSLTDEEKSDACAIRENLGDETYIKGLLGDRETPSYPLIPANSVLQTEGASSIPSKDGIKVVSRNTIIDNE